MCDWDGMFKGGGLIKVIKKSKSSKLSLCNLFFGLGDFRGDYE